MLTDHLGSSRVVSDALGTILDYSDFYPFGGERIITSSSGNTYKFTGKERDESGLDNFGARYFASGMGRFMSPDWSAKIEPVPYSKLDNPQSLNLYSYTLNNPLSNVDTDGHACSGLLLNTGSGFCTRATEYGKIGASSDSIANALLCGGKCGLTGSC
jgi:RHS repeat-associated protein